jgi:DNA-binding transcriptional regulator YiaG
MKTQLMLTTAFRAHYNLSQADLARLLPVNVRTLQDWEQGRGNPAPYLARALQDVARELKTSSARKERTRK